GDAELSATVSPEQVDEVLKLIKVSKVPLRNPGGNPTSLKRRLSEHAQGAETHESAQVVSYSTRRIKIGPLGDSVRAV
ncbi:MAG: hypothetical protein JSU63_08490, partial [Phycisphaerales bacterium]